MSAQDSLDQLRDQLRRFARERSWERYHTPKNLTTALAGEAGELAAVLQWATPEESIEPHRPELEEEVGDVRRRRHRPNPSCEHQASATLPGSRRENSDLADNPGACNAV